MAKPTRPTKCFSVRLKNFIRISEIAYKAIAFDGSSAIIPASQYFGEDIETTKSKGYWLTEWILKKTKLQHKLTDPKVVWFDKDGNKCQKPERGPRKTTFTVTYKKKRDNKTYTCKTIAENKEVAEKNIKEKFSSEKLQFKPSEGDLEIVSIETRPDRNK